MTGILTNASGIKFTTQTGGREMFEQAIIHYPSDENALKRIDKEIAAFWCAAAIKYIESLKLNDRQIETLFNVLEKEITARNENDKSSKI